MMKKFKTEYIWSLLRACMFVLFGLMLAGCQPGGEDEHPIFSVVRDNDANRLGQYLAEGGDPNVFNDRDSLLYVASGAKGGLEVVQRLVLAEADLNAISREGRTALHTAAAWCNTDIVALLLEAGARTDIKNSENKFAVDVVCVAPLVRREPVLALFLQSGAGQN